jgi:hypothetical protein
MDSVIVGAIVDCTAGDRVFVDSAVVSSIGDSVVVDWVLVDSVSICAAKAQFSDIGDCVFFNREGNEACGCCCFCLLLNVTALWSWRKQRFVGMEQCFQKLTAEHGVLSIDFMEEVGRRMVEEEAEEEKAEKEEVEEEKADKDKVKEANSDDNTGERKDAEKAEEVEEKESKKDEQDGKGVRHARKADVEQKIIDEEKNRMETQEERAVEKKGRNKKRV